MRNQLVFVVCLLISTVVCQQRLSLNDLLDTHFNCTGSCSPSQKCVPKHECTDKPLTKTNCNNGCEPFEICCNIPKKTNTPAIATTPESNFMGCGVHNPEGIGARISTNEVGKASFGEFPWMVAILFRSTYECGGSLIAPSVVLTSSHCVYNKAFSKLTVLAGEWDFSSQDELYEQQDRSVKEVILHEKFDQAKLHNDIALLILANPFVLAHHIQPICLPELNTNFEASNDCFVSGWGKDNLRQKVSAQNILKKTKLPMMSHARCQEIFRTTILGKYFIFDKSFTCAGGEENEDACVGDGGSPLVCPVPGSNHIFAQVGIVAWGVGCGEKGIPGAYANVPYLRSWINEKLTAKNINFNYFTPTKENNN